VLTRFGFAAAALMAFLPLQAAGASEQAGGNNIFNADIGNLIFTLIVFGLVVLLLGKFAWKPLLTVLNEREKTIRDSLEAARQQREQAEQLMAEHRRQLDQARQEASEIVAEGRRDAEVVRQKIQEQARREGAEIIARARREIKLATETAIKELYDQTAELSVRIAASIIRKQLTPEDHRQLIAESLQEMKSSGKAGLN